MHHLCIVRGVEKQLWWSRVIQEKVLDPWGLVQVVFNNKEKDPWPCQEEQVDISTTVERFQESADEMTAYQLSTSDVITTLMSLPSPMILRHPLRLPFSLLIPLSVPLHLTTPPRTRPLAALLRSLWRSKMMLQLRGYFANQGTTNFSLRLAGIRRGGEKTLTSADSTSLNYLTHAGRMVLSGPAGCKAFYFFLGSLYLFCQFGLIPSTTRNPTNLPTETHEVSTNRLPYYAILLPIAIYPASCLDRRDPNQPLLTGPLLITRLSMPLLNVNMPCPLLFWLVFIGLFHCRASSPDHYTISNLTVPPPTYAMTSPGFNDVSRDNISLIITQYLGLPPLYSHPTIPLSVHYSFKLFYRPQKLPFTLCSRSSRRPILIAFSRTLILLLLCSSGDVEVNPGPAVPSSTPIPQALSFDDFCNRNSLGFMHVNIRSLLPKFVLFTALAHSANPDVLAVSESWLRKRPPKILTFSSPTTRFSDKIERPKGAVLQSIAKIACRVLFYYPGLFPNNLNFYF
ncbi:uncharacterized protein ACWYII_023767 isoform 2-T4 [Salvelinus alpinus]|uniref:uncharacterized protein isoform X2 n=1 Tax=Salvelinus alpinus TaxID=8036 RepID=UPI0039FCA0CD